MLDIEYELGSGRTANVTTNFSRYVHPFEFYNEQAMKREQLERRKDSVFNDAIDFLFEGQEVTDEKRKRLKKYMYERMKDIHVVVMYRPSEKAAEVCRELGLNMGTREVDIDEKLNVVKRLNFQVA